MTEVVTVLNSQLGREVLNLQLGQEIMRENNIPEVDDYVNSKPEETFTYEELLDLITSFHETEITLEECDYCGLMSRNMRAHKRLNHNKRKSVRFPGSNPKK